ncbi:MAG: YidC/Oxa1 family membrane protein insertase [Clostridiales bacterium]|nr:YidC/Oxa1 family membrane protein insertase [Clostridiales bacterium]
MAILYVPFGWILRVIYEFIGSYGWALIVFTLITRLLLLPSTIHQQKGNAKQLRIQPKMNKIRQKYAGNQQKMNEEMQALYKREGFNPMNQGCLPLLVQLPIMWGLYGVIYKPLTYVLNLNKFQDGIVTKLTDAVTNLVELSGKGAKNSLELYVFNYKDQILNSVDGIQQVVIDKINNFDFTFLGVAMGAQPDIHNPSLLWLIPILSGVSSLLTSIYTFLNQKKQNPEMAKNPMGCMIFGLPIISVTFAFSLPAGIGIYWIISNLFAFVQTVALSFVFPPKKVVARDMILETIERRSRENSVKLVAEKNN